MSPIFIYSCPKCEKTFELIRRIAQADDPAFCDCGEQCKQEVAKPAKMVRGSGGWSSPA